MLLCCGSGVWAVNAAAAHVAGVVWQRLCLLLGLGGDQAMFVLMVCVSREVRS